ncbi:MAG: 30S ribosomal protein S16 [Gemmatimonadota bacterium]
MAVRIRLRRMGAKKQPVYRVVVADSRSPRDGRFLDTIGTYDPRANPAAITIDAAKALQWLEQGALPTDSARSLLAQAGVWSRFAGGTPPAARTTTAAPPRVAAVPEAAPAEAEAPPETVSEPDDAPAV